MNEFGRHELIQSAKSKLYHATRFQKQKSRDGSIVPKKASSAFVLSPAVSLTSFEPTDSKMSKIIGKVDTPPWPNVKNYYELLEIVGVGTTAKVYAAFCTQRKEKCAIKMVDLKKWKPGLENLMKDVQVMTSLNHGNLVTYYTAFADRDELWFVLKYMEHRSLSNLISRKMRSTNCTLGVFDEETIASIVTGVLSGLEYIHANRFIHRDMKAENILLGADGQVKISDFTTVNCKARFSSYVGSPCWLAPEIIEDPEHKYTSKADIWSLGITAIEMATGHPPYYKHPTMKVLMCILLNESPSLETDAEVRDQYKSYGKTFRSLIRNCLQKTPTERPSANELLFHPFFKKAKDRVYLQQIFAGVPPDSEARFQKPIVKNTCLKPQERREWIPEPDEIIKPDEPTLTEDNQADQERGSIKTSGSLKTRSSVGPKQSRLLSRPLAQVFSFTLKIRGLNLDTPMVLKTAIWKERELFDIKFSYYVDRDTPEGIASDLVREGLIDPVDRIPVASNLKTLVKAAVLGSITFRLISDVTNTETASEWRLVGYALLSLTSIQSVPGSRSQSISSNSP